MRAYLCITGALALTACASVPSEQKPPTASQVDTGEPRIDALAIQRSLGLTRPADELGYAEKAFNTCQIGYGYSSTHDCRTQNFVVIHFQIQCRDSEGTISHTDYSTRPAANEQIRWNLGKAEGYVQTDGDGIGQITWIAPSSPRNQKLRLTLEKKYLILTANEVKRIVAPDSWCPR